MIQQEDEDKGTHDKLTIITVKVKIKYIKIKNLNNTSKCTIRQLQLTKSCRASMLKQQQINNSNETRENFTPLANSSAITHHKSQIT